METTRHGLRRELKLWDLVPMQVVLIVWLGWTGFAAKRGSSQVALWLFAIVLFYLPLAAVVVKLSRAIPVEGGVYQWVKEGISPFAGYMAGWNYTIYALAAFAVIGSLFANGLAYAVGPAGAWMSASKPFALVLTAAACVITFVSNVRGRLEESSWGTAVESEESRRIAGRLEAARRRCGLAPPTPERLAELRGMSIAEILQTGRQRAFQANCADARDRL